MSRLNKANEIIELAILMQNSYCGLTIDDIAEEFNCSRRSAERMKAVLFEKFPDKIEEVEHSLDKKKRWRFKKGAMNWLISFTQADFANLELCKKQIKEPAKQKEIQEIIAKIEALNPNKISKVDVEELLLGQAFTVRQGFRESINLDTIRLINDSILTQKQIRGKYYDKDVTLNPYGIIYSDKAYLIAHNGWAKEVWTYRLSKLTNVELTDTYFEKDENFNLQEFANRAFGIYQGEIYDVELLFNTDSAKDASEYNFHPTQKGKWNDDGSYTLTFKASGEWEIITEILKWRDSVKIIAPKKLKDIYFETVEKMYQNTMKG